VPRTIGALLAEQAARPFGRESERAALGRLTARNGPLVVFVHGLAGVGKSALLDAAAHDARARDVAVVAIDCQTVEPTESGLLRALGRSPESHSSVDELASRLSGGPEPVLILLDGYESLRALDSWVRSSLLPQLGTNVRLVIASREAPPTGWAATLGTLFQELPLANLPPDAAVKLLGAEGVSAVDAVRVNRLARGHPLALRLSAAALRARPDLDLEGLTVRTVVDQIARVYLDVLDDGTRLALDAACVVRRPTRALLAAILPDAPPDAAFERLRDLPFVTSDQDGLVIHETVREAVAAALRAEDPARHRSYRVAAWRQLRGELEDAVSRQLWRYTADMLYLLENNVLRDGYFPTTERMYSVEQASAEDGEPILEIVARHETATTAGLLARWLAEVPQSFRVARDPGGNVAAVLCMCEFDAVPYGLVDADAVASSWRDHLRRNPVPRGRRVLVTRCRLARDSGEAVSTAQAALWLDITRLSLALRPELRRRYTVFRDLQAFGPILAPLGFREVPGSPVVVDGVEHHVPFLDFGPASVDGWLSGIVAAELGIDEAGGSGMLDVHRRQLVLVDGRVDLTRLEFDLFQYLEQRRGRVLERSMILRDVWGYDWDGSNVIETAVSSLRKKLGDRAWMVETVRGVGYRFRGERG
jgi:hypothetical protein